MLGLFFTALLCHDLRTTKRHGLEFVGEI